jgi:hypothetical protein
VPYVSLTNGVFMSHLYDIIAGISEEDEENYEEQKIIEKL